MAGSRSAPNSRPVTPASEAGTVSSGRPATTREGSTGSVAEVLTDVFELSASTDWSQRLQAVTVLKDLLRR